MQDRSEQHGDDGAWRQQAASAADNAKSAFDAASAGVKQRARMLQVNLTAPVKRATRRTYSDMRLHMRPP